MKAPDCSMRISVEKEGWSEAMPHPTNGVYVWISAALPYGWLRARLQYRQCISNGDTAVLCQAIDIRIRICRPRWLYLGQIHSIYLIKHDIPCCTAVTQALAESEFVLTKNTPYLILMNELWGVYSEDLCTAIYMVWVTEVWLSCYLVLLSVNNKTR